MLAHPHPPRPVGLVEFVPLVYPTIAVRVAAGVGIVAGIGVVALAVATWGQAADSPLLLAVGLGLGVALPLVPLVAAVRVRRAVRLGLLARGPVVEITEQRAAGDTDPARAERGRTVGTIDVAIDARRFTADLDTDRAWGLDLDRGATVVILVHPDRDHIWMWLGTTTVPGEPARDDADAAPPDP